MIRVIWTKVKNTMSKTNQCLARCYVTTTFPLWLVWPLSKGGTKMLTHANQSQPV